MDQYGRSAEWALKYAAINAPPTWREARLIWLNRQKCVDSQHSGGVSAICTDRIGLPNMAPTGICPSARFRHLCRRLCIQSPGNVYGL